MIQTYAEDSGGRWAVEGSSAIGNPLLSLVITPEGRRLICAVEKGKVVVRDLTDVTTAALELGVAANVRRNGDPVIADFRGRETEPPTG
jgi:hypothetical protein